MLQDFENLKFSVLVSFVLVNFFDGNMLTGLRIACFVDDAEGTIADNLFGCVALWYLFLPLELFWNRPWVMWRNHISQIWHHYALLIE